MPSVVSSTSYPTDNMVAPRMEEADNYHMASKTNASRYPFSQPIQCCFIFLPYIFLPVLSAVRLNSQ